VTDGQKGYLQALADVRSWHRWQIGQAVGDVRVMQAHESAVAWLDVLIATKKQHAAEDKAERRQLGVNQGDMGAALNRPLQGS
jgi:hypothetical protein